MQTLRIFISSPGDVSSERERAREVIESLQRRYSRHFVLKPIFWEDLPLEADMSFQQGIDVVLSEKGVDIAVFILWSRLGSPLGAAIRKPDGASYRSGTEREYDMMLQARARTRETGDQPRPAMLVYTRHDDASFAEALRSAATVDKQKSLLQQKELLESFLQEIFRDEETGTNIGAYFPFDRPTTFSQRLRIHLKAKLDEMAGEFDEVAWVIEKQGPPFLGLEAFQPEHADVFFGREEEILEARHSLREQARNGCAFLLLSGASGSGKSSLARAGIIPEIVSLEIDDHIASWRTLILTPAELGLDPVAALVTRLADDKLLPDLRNQSDSADELARDLEKDNAGVFKYTIRKAVDVASQQAGGPVRLIILLDQLEELFTGPLPAEKRASFLAVLETFARSGVIWIIATVRSDFYQQIQSEPALVRMKEGQGLFDVMPPPPDALQRLIEEPARLAGLAFEERGGQSLANVILRDAAPHAELLPLVEFVLLELFEKRDDKQQLTFAAYETLGGVEGALAKKAEETFLSLPENARLTLGPVLQALVTLGDKTAEGEPEKVVRQYSPLSAFENNAAAKTLVESFIAARLFTTGSANRTGEASVTLAHESLLRVWSRAVEWAEQNRDFLRVRSRIASRMHEGSPLLPGDPLLATARAHLESQPDGFSADQQDWIRRQVRNAEASSRRARRRRRLALGALGVLTLCAVAGGVLAWNNRQLADIRQAETEREKTRTAAFHLLHRAANLRSSGRLPEAIGLLEEAYSVFPDFSTRSALLDGLVEAPSDLETTFHGFGQGIEKLRFGNDGSLLAVGSKGDGWILKTGQSLAIPSPGRLLALDHSSNGWSGWLEDGRRVKPSATGFDPEPSLKKADEPAWAMATCSGEFVAFVAAGNPGRIVFKSASVDMPERVARLASRAGGWLAAGLEDGSVFAIRPGENAPVRLCKSSGNAIASMAWTTNDPVRLMVGDELGELTIFSPGETAPTQPPRIPCRPVAMEWNPVDDRIAIAGSDGAVRILTLDFQIETLTLHRGPVLSVTWSADGKRLASGGQDGSVALWHPGARQEPFVRRKLLDPVTSLAVSIDGKRIAAGTATGNVFTWDQSDATPWQGEISGGAVCSLAWSPDAAQLAAGTGDDRVLVFEPGKTKIPAGETTANPDEIPVPRVRWSPSGKTIAAASHSGTVRLIDMPVAIPRTLGTLPDLALGLAWNPGGDRIAASSTRGEIFIWDNLSGEQRRLDKARSHFESIGGLAWSPAGDRLASCGNDGTLRLWNPVVSGEPIAVSTPVDSQLEEVVYSDDGKLLATAGSDGFLRIWRADNLEPFAAIHAHGGHAGTVVWRGNRLISASEDASVAAISLDENQWRSRARKLAGTAVSQPKPISP